MKRTATPSKGITLSTCNCMSLNSPQPRPRVLRLTFIQLLVIATTLSVAPGVGTPLSVVQSINDLWSALATKAARETVKAVKANTGMDMDLMNVPMDTFQVMVGRQHHLGLEVEGVTYNLLLGNEAEALQQARQRSSASSSSPTQALPAATALSSFSASSSSPGLTPSTDAAAAAAAPLQLFSGSPSSRTLELPETTLTGPLELVLRGVPEPVAIYAPLSADVGGPVRRVVVEAGVTVGVAGLRRVALRRSLQLPRLPGQYLAEAVATAATGLPEEGFETAPGITYLAAQLRKAALEAAANRSSSSKPGKSGGSQSQQAHQPLLVSLEVETVTHGSLVITSMPELPPPYSAAAAPRLKVRRTAGGTVELSLRQGQVVPSSPPGAAGHPPRPFNPAALTRSWAWPLPYSDSSAWLSYETLLRSVLASHPFANMDSVVRRGIGLRLTRSTIQGVHLISFDMQVRARQPRPPELQEGFQWNETPLEVWEAVVQVQPQSESTDGESNDHDPDSSSTSSSGGGGGSYRFQPLHVKRKHSYQNTLSLSRSAVLLALSGGRNGSLAEGQVEGSGYDQVEMGLAANAQ